MIIPFVISFVLAFFWGLHMKFKVSKTYVISGIILAALIGSYIYYNNPLSIVYSAAVVGISLGAYFGGGRNS